MNVSSQSVRDHHRSLLRGELRGDRPKLKVVDSAGDRQAVSTGPSLLTSDQNMEPSGLYLMLNMSGKASPFGQDEGKFHDTISLVEKPSICLTDTDSGGSGFTETPGKVCLDAST